MIYEILIKENNMDINIQEVLRIYKEELATAKDEAILRRVAQLQLEQEVAELKRRITELESQLKE